MITKILKFEADWCSPCKLLSVLIDSIKDHIPVEIKHIDVDENSELCTKYKIRSIPVLIFLEDDVEVSRLVGLQTKEQILKQLNNGI